MKWIRILLNFIYRIFFPSFAYDGWIKVSDIEGGYTAALSRLASIASGERQLPSGETQYVIPARGGLFWRYSIIYGKVEVRIRLADQGRMCVAMVLGSVRRRTTFFYGVYYLCALSSLIKGSSPLETSLFFVGGGVFTANIFCWLGAIPMYWNQVRRRVGVEMGY
jgi:hypothetical protein